MKVPLKSSSYLEINDAIYGIIIAVTIIGLWAISLILLLTIDIAKVNIFFIFLGILLQTFLYTGLFITAHDAMHGAVFPGHPKINNLIGSLSVWLYGMFSYQELLKKHWLHHRHPGTETDPDFHNNKHKNFWAWYFTFMKNYWTWQVTIGFTFIFQFASLALHVPRANLTLFWGIPALLSSLQLFYFGTYLPHREPEEGYTNEHRAQSSKFPVFWSFISCYHFGYHEEHHEYPHLPWWRLPEAFLQNQVIEKS